MTLSHLDLPFRYLQTLLTPEEPIMPAQKTRNITKIDRSQPLLHQHGHEIQQYGRLRDLPISLSPDPRAESCTLVNQILADTSMFKIFC